MNKFTFEGIKIGYETRNGIEHRMIIDLGMTLGTEIGPWVNIGTPISYELKGRYFICQKLTDLLPVCYELIPPKEIRLETIEPHND